jgi:hypothetical protein
MELTKGWLKPKTLLAVTGKPARDLLRDEARDQKKKQERKQWSNEYD